MAGSVAIEAGGETQEWILRAALADFSANGFDGARTREIAARAGVPLGLLRYHFGDKARLWRASVDRAFEELRAGLEAILADPQPVDLRERLRRVIRGHVHFVAGNPEFVRLMHDEGKRGGPRMRWMVDRHVKPAFQALVPLIESAQSAGILPGRIDPIHFIYALAGAAGVIFHQSEECKRLSGIDPMNPAAVEAHARTVEHLFLGSSHEETLS